MTPCQRWLKSNGWEDSHTCHCKYAEYLRHCTGCNEIVECLDFGPSDPSPNEEIWCGPCWREVKPQRDFVRERIHNFFGQLGTIFKIAEYREEARRCRRIVKGMMDGLDTQGVAVEFYRDPGSAVGIGLVICAPGLNEANLGTACKEVMEDYWAACGGKPGDIRVGKVRVMGTGGE